MMYTHNETLKEGGRKVLMMCGVYSLFRWPSAKSKRNMKPLPNINTLPPLASRVKKRNDFI